MTLRYLTSGESHGPALLGIIEGIPAGLELDSKFINRELLRRKLGYGRGARQKIEDDNVQILSGVRFGATLGSPIGLLIYNRDWDKWQKRMQVEQIQVETPPPYDETNENIEIPRPGHADLPGSIKYGHLDMRNVLERASARETAIRVAIGTVARCLLEQCGVVIASRVVQIGEAVDPSLVELPLKELNSKADLSPVRCLGKEAETSMLAAIDSAQMAGDSVGGVFEVLAEGLPIGLGSYAQWDRRLGAEIGRQFLGLNAIKGVEIGAGFKLASLPGSEAHDEIVKSPEGQIAYASNRSGGLLGGVTTGQRLLIRAAMKPIATLKKPLRSVNTKTKKPAPAHFERSDVCAVPAAAVIGESLTALILASAILDKFGGDSLGEILPRIEAWREQTNKS